MNIGEIAERTGLATHTIRFYEKNGILPKIERTEGGFRQFSESDVVFLKFITALKSTGMSLTAITEFTQDGCILERLQAGIMPTESVLKRKSILQKHMENLLEQRQEIDNLIDMVKQKIDYYEEYLFKQT